MNKFEINERIAGIRYEAVHIWEKPDGTKVVKACTYHHPTADHNDEWIEVDYITDNNINHELVVELGKAGVRPNYFVHGDYWVYTNPMAVASHKDFNTATALAYIEEFGK